MPSTRYKLRYFYSCIATIIGTAEEVQTAVEWKPERMRGSSSLVVRWNEIVEGLFD